MRRSVTMRFDQAVLDVAKMRAKTENRTLTNYVETLIRKDVTMEPSTQAQRPQSNEKESNVISVFLAEPITERLITDHRDGDTQEDINSRQEFLDYITGWDNK